MKNKEHLSPSDNYEATIRRIETSSLSQLKESGFATLELSLTDSAILVAELVENLFYENHARLSDHPQIELIPQTNDTLKFACDCKVKFPLRTDINFSGILANGPAKPHLVQNRLDTHISNGLARISFKARGLENLAKDTLNNLDQAFIRNFSHHVHQLDDPIDIAQMKISIKDDRLLVLIYKETP